MYYPVALIEQTRKRLQTETARASDALRAFPRLENGLTPDSVKATEAWKDAKAAYHRAFEALRAFNAKYRPRNVRD